MSKPDPCKPTPPADGTGKSPPPTDPAFSPVPGRKPIPKFEKNGWVIVDTKGKFSWIEKIYLNVDPEYQRTSVSKTKVNEIAARWSWAACLCLGVARRPDGTLWVFDGQHRTLAANKRADIDKLPCMVFESEGKIEEAKAFIAANVCRGPVRAIDKFNALCIAQDPLALRVKKIVESSGYSIRRIAPGSMRSVQCVSALMWAVKTDDTLAATIWNLAVQIFAGDCVQEDVFRGLFSLELFLRRDKTYSLFEAKLKDMLRTLGPLVLVQSIRNAKVLHGGGPKAFAEGIGIAINRKRKKGQKIPTPYNSNPNA